MKMKINKSEFFGIQRKMVASVTTDSWHNIPHISYIYEPEVSELFKEYKKINAGRSAENKITFNTVMLKVIVEGIKAAPIMNSHIKYDHRLAKGRIDTFENINISMPTILPNGEMMTTNLHNFQDKNIDEMTEYIKALRERAEKSDINEALYRVSFNKTVRTIKEGKITQALLRIAESKVGKTKIKTLSGKSRRMYYAVPETERLSDRDIEQGTVTISNIGSIYRGQKGAAALLEVIPPQVAVFCIGAIQEKPIIKEINGKKDIVIGHILPICIALDHRAMDFGEAAPFLERLDEIFSHPEIIHEWVND